MKNQMKSEKENKKESMHENDSDMGEMDCMSEDESCPPCVPKSK